MNSSETVKTDISALDADISRYLSQTRDGIMIDIATLPDRITDIHRRIQNSTHHQRPELSKLLNQVINALDELAREVQFRHDALSRDIEKLDEATRQ